MKKALLIFVTLLVMPAAAQDGAGHFSKEGLAFDYPAGWTFADTGDAKLQRLMLRRDGASNIIMVFAQRELITTSAQLHAARVGVTLPYVTNIAYKLGLNQPPPLNEAKCLNVGGHAAVGFRMGGVLDGESTTAEVYTVVLGRRLLHLVHVRADKDEAAGEAAWKKVLDTLKVDAPAQASPEADKIEQFIAGGVLNNRVAKKPQPKYPPMALASRTQGTVTVEVVVDENGNVVSARAVAGPGPLRDASEDAARKAKFEPTAMCGQPVKVMGIITYNFVLR